jgi:hypothetical protein
LEKVHYTIDGKAFSTIEEFAKYFSATVLRDHTWRGNLDAFNDILRGGFGTPDGCAYRKSHPPFRRLHLQELSSDTTNWHLEFSFPGLASFIWLSSLLSFSLHAPFLRLDWN